MKRRPTTNRLLSPVLIGSVTVLLLIVATTLAYRANVGLPFVPVRILHVDVANGSDITRSNDVLEGGYRIGYVQSMRPIRLPDGQPGGQLTLALSTTHGRLPVDSTAEISSRSVLGLKYVNIVPGHAHQIFPNGGTMPVNQTHVPVQFSQLLGTYNRPTRAAVQQNLISSGNLFAGRGAALNDTLAALPRLLSNLSPVAAYLAARSTNLTGFFAALNGFTTTLAPVTHQTVGFFAHMATTWQALSSDPRALETAIAKSPSTLAVSTASLIAQRPLLVNLTRLGSDLTPAAVELGRALPAVNGAIAAGTRTLARTPPLDRRLQATLVALQHLAQAPTTGVALNGLTDTVNILNPAVRYLGPFVTVCNDWNYWWTNLAGDLDEATNFGFAQRALSNQANSAQPNNVGSQGATAPVNGGGTNSLLTGGNEYAHGPAYGAAVDAQGNADCETGQRGYPLKLNGLDPQGRNFDSDVHTPGDQGPTFTGAAHVPAGETFTRSPTTGAIAPFVASNP
ncbi:MAG TPA: MlaD family protein [Solirubrobacteraceae bacterium]|nr:MlaD family protein [Solirubrobacteraceae bacterium]